MTASPTAPPRRHGRKILVLAIVVAVVAAGWSVAWFWLAGRLEETVHAVLVPPPGEGTAICTPGRVTGFPFRIDLGCTDVVVTEPAGGTVRLPAIAATSFVYRPDHVVAELAQPMTVTPEAGPPVEIGWSRALVGGRWRPRSIDSADLSVTAPTIRVAGTEAGGAALFEVHLRRTPDDAGGTDVAVSFDQAALDGSSLPPVDFALVATLRDGGRLLEGRGFAVPAPDGLTIRIDKLSIGDAEHALLAHGRLQLRPDGLLDGDLDVGLGDPAALAGLMQRYGTGGSLPQVVAGAAAAFGRTDNGETFVKLTIRGGRAAIGFVPLFAIPPLPLPPTRG